jgi:hypothetical protein
MNWLLDNLQFVIIVATTIAWWLNQRHAAAKAAREEEEEMRRQAERGEPAMDFAEEADEHARRVQEEIRRKITARRGEALPSPLETLFEPEPARWEEVAPPPLPLPPPEPAPVARAEWGTEDAGALERHRRLDEELERLERQQQDAERRAREVGVPAAGRSAVRPASAYAMTEHTGSIRRADAHWLQTLRNPREARRAIVLRELLDTPVALRR